jgi:hypothetical protein
LVGVAVAGTAVGGAFVGGTAVVGTTVGGRAVGVDEAGAQADSSAIANKMTPKPISNFRILRLVFIILLYNISKRSD